MSFGKVTTKVPQKTQNENIFSTERVDTNPTPRRDSYRQELQPEKPEEN